MALPWGVSLIDGYGVEIVELDVAKLGLPRAQQDCSKGIKGKRMNAFVHSAWY